MLSASKRAQKPPASIHRLSERSYRFHPVTSVRTLSSISTVACNKTVSGGGVQFRKLRLYSCCTKNAYTVCTYFYYVFYRKKSEKKKTVKRSFVKSFGLRDKSLRRVLDVRAARGICIHMWL